MAQSKNTTGGAIQSWLVTQLANLISVAPETIDVNATFESYGLASREAVMLAGDLEAWLNRRLSPTLVYEYPSIAALAEYLAQPQAEPGTIPTLAPLHDTAVTHDDAVAVVGLGCRFPGATGPDAFWQLLRDGVDAISEVPPDRWDMEAFFSEEPGEPGKMYTRWGGFLPDADQFDPQFFGISPREAARMDPQQRLLLETTWEALEHAGYAPDGLANSATAVYVGISSNDYSLLQHGDYTAIDAYTGTGNAFSIAANRLSYLLNLRGPSMAIDTACSSSLVAIHLACRSLLSGETNMALASGVNLILSPELNITFSHARMMSLDGRCKTFDADADGYVRGEGCGVVVLKRLSDAQADGDHILAVIRGTAVNHDGHSNGITAPNAQAQQAVIRQALHNAGISPAQLDYVEAHGTGTRLGDPIEVEALGAVMHGRSPDNPLMLGSVKTNIGHLESAAGVAGFIKTVLMLQHGEVPPHLHFKQINPYIPIDEMPLTIPTQRRPWPVGDTPRYAGISSFGFGGTNAHVVLEAAPPVPPVANELEREWQILALSARDESALADLAERYANFLEANTAVPLADITFSANTGRSRFPYRLALAGSSHAELVEKLTATAQGQNLPGVNLNKAVPDAGEVAFLFTGQGAQYPGMGFELYNSQPVFRAALDRCAAILADHLERPLLDIMFADPTSDAADLLHETAYTQPALFAIEYALAQLWQSWGIQPDYVMGHSVGEYVAACIAGVFSLEDGLKLIAARGRLMQSLPQNGEMAVVFADQARVVEALHDYRGKVDIAAVNGPNNTVISGEREAVQALVRTLQADDVLIRPLRVSHAFHSPLMDPILPEFLQIAREVKYSAPRIGFVSNVIGQLWNPEVVPEAVYWQRHIRRGVQFAGGMQALAQAGCRVFVEVGPHPSLIGMGSRCLPGDYTALWLPSLKRNEPEWPVLLDSVGAAFASGLPLDWRGFDQGYVRRKVHVPTYPFQRQRYWIEEKTTAASRTAVAPTAASGDHPLLGHRLASPLRAVQYQAALTRDILPAHAGDAGLLPAAAYLEMAQAAAAGQFNTHRLTLADVAFPAPRLLTADTAVTQQFILTPDGSGEAHFEVFSLNDGATWTQHSSGQVRPAEASDAPTTTPLADVQARCTTQLPTDALGEALARLGLHAMSLEAWLGSGEILIRLDIDDNDRIAPQTIALDAAFQALSLLAAQSGRAGTERPLVAAQLEQAHLYGRFSPSAWAHIALVSDSANADENGTAVRGSVRLYDAAGDLLIEAAGVTLAPLDDALWQTLQANSALAAERTLPAAATAGELSANALRALPHDERRQQLEAYLRAQLANVLHLSPDQIDVQRPVNFFGLDSIMAIELKNSIERGLQVNLPIASLLQGPNISQLTAELVDQLDEAAAGPKIVAASAGPGEYPLSYGQRALWFQHQVNPGAVFNPRYAVRVQTAVDLDAMRRAFQILVDRHAALRTTFIMRDGELFQIVSETGEAAFDQVDAGGWSDEELTLEMESAAYQPFDLVRGPLLRVTLFSRGSDDHVLLLTAHHIVVDLWSLAVLVSELGVLLSTGDAQELPPTSLAYTDYVRWHNDLLTGPDGELLWEYWRHKLEGHLPVLELPTDKPRPAVQTHNGAAQSLTLDAALTHQLEAISEEHGVTLFVTLLAAFKALLHHYSRQEDIIVGTPTTGRSRSQLTDLVGYFVNPVALRSQVTGKLRFSDLMQQVQQTVVEAIDHQDYPIALVVEKLKPDRDPSHLPIFQVMFIMQRAHLLYDEGLSQMAVSAGGMQMRLGGLDLESVPVPERTAPFDLTLMVAPSSDSLAASLTYNTDLFRESTIARVLEHYRTLLTGIVANPDTPVADLPLLTAAELDQLLRAFNDTQRELPQLECCVHELFAQQAAKTPNATAVAFNGSSFTYAQLDARTNQLAHYLRRQGVGPETLVGISVRRSVEMVVGLLGILKAGGTYLPLDPTYPTERVSYMLADARPRVLLTQEALRAELPPFAGQVICLDSEWEHIAQETAAALDARVSGDNLAYVIYTSGSTGRPKGVLLNHRGLCNLVQAQTEGFGIDANSRVLQFASFSFDASVSEIFMALLTGGTLHLAEQEKLAAVDELHALLRDEGITAVTLPPSLLATLPQDGLDHLRTIISAGEACTPEVARRWANGRRLFNAYGPTEATIGPTFYRVRKAPKSSAHIPIGHPIHNMRIYLLDERQHPVPIGVPGEIYISGIGVARGYLNRPDLTASKFIPNPFGSNPGERFYRTGDLARYRSDGSIEFLGRIDQQVKLRGFRIELGEIEAALRNHASVRECAGLVREDTPGDQRLVAYVVPETKAPNISALRTYLQKHLPEYMIPSNFVMLDRLPVSPNGKLDRKALPAPSNERPQLETEYVRPTSEAERMLAQVWQEVLGVDRVGINDNFFELGGHSLLAARVYDRIQGRFKRSLTMVELFRYPTIRALSEYLLNDEDDLASLRRAQSRARQQRQAMRNQLRQLQKQSWKNRSFFRDQDDS